jgi:hypothetical protein
MTDVLGHVPYELGVGETPQKQFLDFSQIPTQNEQATRLRDVCLMHDSLSVVARVVWEHFTDSSPILTPSPNLQLIFHYPLTLGLKSEFFSPQQIESEP